ncbi:NACHT domain-containing protein [Ktedonosporobacter rubrisoli]|uniref:NACHT domain-containing protein n=1 Tax=Ktedonosporobacter rubrisoli TaxID=2509675 RepID=A0A4P6JVZ6_KTERU|nr:NACHT domain-containing protein [Ktedonosporobacter rubrisoli]QBD79847.1 NACHT domain-containing protein [Ktedonosporobacter rubrisoli]
MVDNFALIALYTLLANGAASWLGTLGSTVFSKEVEFIVEKSSDFALTRGKGLTRRAFRLDTKEQEQRLAQALKNAAERGLIGYKTLQERDQYRDVINSVAQPGPLGEELRRECLRLFTLADEPDLDELSCCYNQRKRRYDHSHQDINAAPYLQSFFMALLGELYADPYFRSQLSDALQLRAANKMQHSLCEIIALLKELHSTLTDSYTAEEFESDVAKYAEYLERTLRNLKIVGVVPRDLKADPELSGIFVPLRVGMDEILDDSKQLETIEAALEQASCLVLLGEPGAGKSTATKYLAWCHAAAQQGLNVPASALLADHPLPLRIELRRLSQERQRADYSFLSFACEVMLKRDEIEINPQMFKELLMRHRLLLLFDGLDEVATLDERLQLVQEIEHFAQCHPGNRVLVTSRPVGYQLAPISHPLFEQARVMGFNDEQIEQYVYNWYTAVLRLNPIPQVEQEEMDLLLTNLRRNPRLHRLAENPLLLTVMTALHRYQRLPDRRVLIYDRCAELLLETWAKLKGTHQRWQHMKMGRDDQYACVAYLGYALHERSQEVISDEWQARDTTVDVPERYLRQQVEKFFCERGLLSERAEQRVESERFIELVKIEAGLIVERGSDENGEALYSFVHRTFQEYFAAVDVYERYQQAEDAQVVRKFLIAHLHDPHWREVIFLLLGKLKSGPVTRLLQALLEGKLQSQRSRYTEIVQQDLFFVCDCLLEEIRIGNKLVELVKEHLCKLIKESPFPSQRQEALEYLGRLGQTRQYAGQGWEELLALATKDNVLDIMLRLDVAIELYARSGASPNERALAQQALCSLLQHPEFPVDQVQEKLEYPTRRGCGEAVVFVLEELLRRADLTIERTLKIVELLFWNSEEGTEERQLAIETLEELLRRADLTIEQKVNVAESLSLLSEEGTEERQLAIETLEELLRRADLTIEQKIDIAKILYMYGEEGTEERLVSSMLVELLQGCDLTDEQTIDIARLLYQSSEERVEERQLASMTLRELLNRMDVTIEQKVVIACYLYLGSEEGTEERQQALFMFTHLLSCADFRNDMIYYLISWLYLRGEQRADERELMNSTLTKLLSRADLPIEQKVAIANALFPVSGTDTEVGQLVESALASLLQRTDLIPEQRLLAAEALCRFAPRGTNARLFGTATLLTLLSRHAYLASDKDVYYSLRSTIPYFHKLPTVDLLPEPSIPLEQTVERTQGQNED